MPKIKVSALITGIKGKSEGSVFSNNRGGAYYRSNRNFGAKSSKRWNTQRASFGELSQQWRKLTANQQIQWNNAAANYPAIDAWGNPRTRSGYETYMYLNATLKKLGIADNTTPPAPIGTIDHELPQVAVLAGPIINISWPIAMLVNDTLNIYAGAVVSTGRGFVPGKMKYMGSQNAVGSNVLDIAVPYVEQFGNLPSSGRLWVMTESINPLTGEHDFKQWNFVDIGVVPTTGIGFMVIQATFTVT